MISKQLLHSLREDVLSLIDITENEFAPLDEDVLNWKESPEKWSMLQCLEHLNRYSLYYNEQIRKSITQAKKSDLSSEAKSTWLGKKFINMMHPGNASKQKTLARMNPLKGSLNKSVVDNFLAHQKDLLELLKKAGDVNLDKNYVPVEFMKILKMNLGDALQFVIVHEQRHINQAKKVKVVATRSLFSSPVLKV